MTLEEAIRHCEEIEKQKNEESIFYLEHDLQEYIPSCDKCRDEHRQLADWLKLLKRILDSGDCNTCALLHSQCRYAPRLGELVRYNCPFYCSMGKEGGEEC